MSRRLEWVLLAWFCFLLLVCGVIAKADTTLRVVVSNPGNNKVTAETMFPVEIEMEQISPESLNKGEILRECRVKVEPADAAKGKPAQSVLNCRDGRKFVIKVIRF